MSNFIRNEKDYKMGAKFNRKPVKVTYWGSYVEYCQFGAVV